MKKLLATLICACGLIAMTSTASFAFLIIDTGVPIGDQGVALNGGQFLAGQITLEQAYILTAVEGWLRGNAGSMTFSLYGDTEVGDENIPDVNNRLHSTVFGVSARDDAGYDWFGPSNMNIDLDPGTFWVAFEVLSGDTYQGHMLGYGEVPQPLDKYAFFSNDVSPKWWNQQALKLGVRVWGEESSVIPEPATMVLFGIGLTGMALKKRRG